MGQKRLKSGVIPPQATRKLAHSGQTLPIQGPHRTDSAPSGSLRVTARASSAVQGRHIEKSARVANANAFASGQGEAPDHGPRSDEERIGAWDISTPFADVQGSFAFASF